MVTFAQDTAIIPVTPQTLNAPAFGDIDGDGDLDLFLGLGGFPIPNPNDIDIVAYYRNDGTTIDPTYTLVGPPPFALNLPDPSIEDDLDANFLLPDPNSPTAPTDTSPLAPGLGVRRPDPNNPMLRIGQPGLSKRTPGIARPTLVDIDGDGDLDIFVGEASGSVFFFRNTGDINNPTFAAPVADPFGITRVQSSDPAATPMPPQTQTAFNAAPKFADIDGDGDLDAFVGRTDSFGGSDGNVEYFLNTGSSTAPTFVRQTGAANPFDGISTPANSITVPAFADVDGDGDIDAFLGETVAQSGQGDLRFFENQGTANAPNFVEITGADNPFDANMLNGTGALEEVAPDFADLNGDGIPDLIFGTNLPTNGIRFFENTTPPPPPPPPTQPPQPPVPPPPPPVPPGDLLTVNANNVFTVGQNNGNTNLQFNLTQTNTGIINEVGVFKVDDANGNIGSLTPGSSGYIQAALARAEAFSALPAGERPNGFGVERQQGISDDFSAGDRFALYSIQNSTRDAVLEARTPLSSVRIGLAGNDALQVSDLGNGRFSLGFEDGSDGSFNDVIVSVEQTGTLPAIGTGELQQQGLEIIDLIDANTPQANLAGRQVQATFTLNREARFNNTVGLYRIDDALGTVNGIAPGQAGYARAAIERRIVSLNLSVGDQQTATTSAVLNGDALYAPFLIANSSPTEFLASNPDNEPSRAAALGLGPPQAYFAFLGANPDSTDHILLLGDNTFGFEDLPNGGDRDYNDLIFTVDIAV